ncbi:hypothetical protein [Fibrobacter sp.]|uniref:hypothetical protein n=1 Tax=Fibrobacter sp. TaxID=35828 RepID=UPI0025BE3971|nr:hypothetical protein [Fibrobacter sp.]
MRFFSRKVFQGRALCTHILFFVLFASLLVSCGDDSVNTPNEDLKDHELSSKREDSKSSSSSRSHRRSSSSSVKGKVSSSSSIKIELPPEDGLDIVYVFEDGTVSGAVALDYFAKGSKISLVELNPDDAYKETKTSFTGEVKNGTYEIKKVKLQQPFVKLSIDGSIKSVLNDKYSSLTLVALGDVTSG